MKELTVSIKLKPFIVPNYVSLEGKPTLRQEGLQVSEGYPVTELDADTLSALCDQFRADLFKKAGKADPQKGSE